jgi:hypothetical protein
MHIAGNKVAHATVKQKEKIQMNINTKAELKGKRFKCLRILKGAGVEDIPAIRASLQKQIETIPGAVMTEDESAFTFNNGQFIFKPKQPKEKIGVLDCGPTFATFEGVRIEYKDIENVFACCFETNFAKYAIHAAI